MDFVLRALITSEEKATASEMLEGQTVRHWLASPMAISVCLLCHQASDVTSRGPSYEESTSKSYIPV